VQLFDFTLATGSTVAMQSWEHRGGTDAASQVILPVGSYTLALTQYYNLPKGNLSDGYTERGQEISPPIEVAWFSATHSATPTTGTGQWTF